VHCTQSGRIAYFNAVRTRVFLCTAQRRDGDCDWFRVVLSDQGSARITFDRRRAGCVLPAG